MDKNETETKTETGYKFFHVRQSRTQEREICLRVDEEVEPTDLIGAFDWDTSNEVFLSMGMDTDWDDEDCEEERYFYVTQLPDSMPNVKPLDAYRWYGTCDISLNEDGTIKVKTDE